MAVTLKQIAEAAGVSRGTVDRVIHGRGHVNPEIEEKICTLAKQMGYQPNRLGRALVMSGREIKLGVICQFSETPFMKMVLEGAERAKAELQSMGTEVYIEAIDSYDADRMIETIDRMVGEGVSGLALTPGNSPEIREKMQQVIAAGVPIITFNSDSIDTQRLSYVGLDNTRAGETCAGLMAVALGAGGKVLPITGYDGNTAHSQRLQSFCDMIRERFPQLALLPTERCFDVDAYAERIVLRAIRTHPDLRGIYLSGSGQAGVCRALRQAERVGQIRVICYDLTQANIDELNRGTIDFIIDQNAYEQGYRPPHLLYDKLVMGIEPPREYLYTDICIKTRFNL